MDEEWMKENIVKSEDGNDFLPTTTSSCNAPTTSEGMNAEEVKNEEFPGMPFEPLIDETMTISDHPQPLGTMDVSNEKEGRNVLQTPLTTNDTESLPTDLDLQTESVDNGDQDGTEKDKEINDVDPAVESEPTQNVEGSEEANDDDEDGGDDSSDPDVSGVVDDAGWGRKRMDTDDDSREDGEVEVVVWSRELVTQLSLGTTASPSCNGGLHGNGLIRIVERLKHLTRCQRRLGSTLWPPLADRWGVSMRASPDVHGILNVYEKTREKSQKARVQALRRRRIYVKAVRDAELALQDHGRKRQRRPSVQPQRQPSFFIRGRISFDDLDDDDEGDDDDGCNDPSPFHPLQLQKGWESMKWFGNSSMNLNQNNNSNSNSTQQQPQQHMQRSVDRILQCLEQVQSHEAQYRLAVAEENACIDRCQALEAMALETLQAMETDRRRWLLDALTMLTRSELDDLENFGCLDLDSDDDLAVEVVEAQRTAKAMELAEFCDTFTSGLESRLVQEGYTASPSLRRSQNQLTVSVAMARWECPGTLRAWTAIVENWIGLSRSSRKLAAEIRRIGKSSEETWNRTVEAFRRELAARSRLVTPTNSTPLLVNVFRDAARSRTERDILRAVAERKTCVTALLSRSFSDAENIRSNLLRVVQSYREERRLSLTRAAAIVKEALSDRSQRNDMAEWVQRCLNNTADDEAAITSVSSPNATLTSPTQAFSQIVAGLAAPSPIVPSSNSNNGGLGGSSGVNEQTSHDEGFHLSVVLEPSLHVDDLMSQLFKNEETEGDSDDKDDASPTSSSPPLFSLFSGDTFDVDFDSSRNSFDTINSGNVNGIVNGNINVNGLSASRRFNQRDRFNSRDSTGSLGSLDLDNLDLIPQLKQSQKRKNKLPLPETNDNDEETVETSLFRLHFFNETLTAETSPASQDDAAMDQPVLKSFACTLFCPGGDHDAVPAYGRLFVTKTTLFFVAWDKKLKANLSCSLQRSRVTSSSDGVTVIIATPDGVQHEFGSFVPSVDGRNHCLQFLEQRIAEVGIEDDEPVEENEVKETREEEEDITTTGESDGPAGKVDDVDEVLQSMEVVVDDTIENVSVRKLYELCCLETSGAFYGPVLKSSGSQNLEVTPWQTVAETDNDSDKELDRARGVYIHPWCGESYERRRTVSFDLERKVLFGPPKVSVQQTQYCRIEGDDGKPQKFVYAFMVKMNGIPYADSFTVQVRWVGTTLGSGVRLRSGLAVDFPKPLMLGGKIRSSAIAEASPASKQLFEAMSNACRDGLSDLQPPSQGDTHDNNDNDGVVHKPSQSQQLPIEDTTMPQWMIAAAVVVVCVLWFWARAHWIQYNAMSETIQRLSSILEREESPCLCMTNPGDDVVQRLTTRTDEAVAELKELRSILGDVIRKLPQTNVALPLPNQE